MKAKILTEIIRERRSVFPNMYDNRPIEKEVIINILENGNWAPTHKHTEPWRFRIFHGEPALKKLSKFLADHYIKKTPKEKFSKKKYENIFKKTLSAACIQNRIGFLIFTT